MPGGNAFVQLDAAAALVGKSEVTLRRLVKSGRLRAHKEKTLTGFIYLVDPQEVKEYYLPKQGKVLSHAEEQSDADSTAAHRQRAGHIAAAPLPDLEPEMQHAVHSRGRVRVAISSESGDPLEYWLKRAEIFEEKYLREMLRQAQLREELGLWRGRAEHAQAMLMKLLPAPTTIEVAAADTASQKSTDPSQNGALVVVVVVLMAVAVLLLATGVIYVILTRK